MSIRDRRLLLHTSPHLAPQLTTPKLMWEVFFAVVPVVVAAAWFFGVGALLVIGAATFGAVATEWYFTRPRSTLRDGSAVLTGILLGLTLPPGLPLWMAFVGGVAGIGLGKLVWGGMGHNLFNPALVGRAFLQAAFPIHLTTWVPSGGDFFHVRSELLALPLMQSTVVDGTSAATPLAMMKFEGETPAFLTTFLGTCDGSLGETSALLLILCGLWMVYRRLFDWRIPVAIFVAVFALSGVLWLVSSTDHPAPWLMLMSGGLLFGAIFMATDPVSSPLSPKATWIYGIGIGVLVVLIRLWGGLPEGVMYAILLMNAATPLIERSLQPRVFGRDVKA